MKVDFIIVGQGLAGSLLAWELLNRQYKILIIDPGQENASKIAAGLINPVSGQRLVLSENLALLLETARFTYQQLSACFKQKFLVELPMLRVLQNPREQQIALQRLTLSPYKPYLSDYLNDWPDIHCPYGLLIQQHTGYLRTRQLLACLREYFIALNCYSPMHMDYRQLQISPQLSWQSITAQHIAFCEGYHAKQNPWFSQLPFQLAKGEILSCEIDNFTNNHILNYGNWLIPIDQQNFKTGASFDPVAINLQVTEQAKNNLLNSLALVIPQSASINVTEQHSGIRPTTLDKQPFIGSHPLYPNLHIFNGFGAKGSLAIPWYAQHFCQALLDNRRLSAHCDIKRYYPKIGS